MPNPRKLPLAGRRGCSRQVVCCSPSPVGSKKAKEQGVTFRGGLTASHTPWRYAALAPRMYVRQNSMAKKQVKRAVAAYR